VPDLQPDQEDDECYEQNTGGPSLMGLSVKQRIEQTFNKRGGVLGSKESVLPEGKPH